MAGELSGDLLFIVHLRKYAPDTESARRYLRTYEQWNITSLPYCSRQLALIHSHIAWLQEPGITTTIVREMAPMPKFNIVGSVYLAAGFDENVEAPTEDEARKIVTNRVLAWARHVEAADTVKSRRRKCIFQVVTKLPPDLPAVAGEG